MESRRVPGGPAPRSETQPLQFLAMAWVFAALLGLYAADDVNSWLTADGEATALELHLGAGLLAAGNATGVVPARKAMEAKFVALRGSATFLPASPPVTPPPPASPPHDRAIPDAGAPRRILLVGASSIEYHLGVELERCLEEFPGVEVRRAGRLGSGLVRPEDFDWAAELARLQTDFRADLVLGQFGGNDCRPIVDPVSGERWLFETDAWASEYHRRVEELATRVTRRGARMGFLGQLAVRRATNRHCFERVDDVTAGGAKAGGAWFLPLRSTTLARSGAVLETVPGPHGSREQMWISDDVHLTRAGGQAVAAKVCTQLERRLSLENADPEKGRILRFETHSTARGRTIPWYAVMPRNIPKGGAPVLYLLHGGGGGVEDWMAAQEQLQRLAVKHALALVVVDGDEWGWYADGLPAGTGIETYLIRELVPEVERLLPVSARRGIAGLSMGGHGALALSLRNPGTFASASSMSGVVDLIAHPERQGLTNVLGTFAEHTERWKDHSARQLLDRRPDATKGLALMLTCGDQDRFLGVNRELHLALERMNVPHVYTEGPGKHDWSYWTQQLPLHVAWHAEQLRSAQVLQE